MKSTRRNRVYRREEMKRLFEPHSIAIVGISPRPGTFGERTLGNLERYTGRVDLVNAKYERIGDRICYPSLRSLPEVPDCAVIVVGREHVEPLVRECADLGVGGAIIFASGYAETGKPERIAEQQRLTDIARGSSLRIVGPNCIGLVNHTLGAMTSFTTFSRLDNPLPASIGIASQSGAMANSLGQAIEQGSSFSHILAAGNSCDIDIADLVSYLADEPHCRSIISVFEGMDAPSRFIEAAEIAWANNKPLIVNKLATGEQGAAAALSHTGSLAGSNAAYRAAFERAGVIMVDRFEHLVETAAFFAKVPELKATGVAVISTSGGASIMSADKAELHGVPLPQPSDATRTILESRIPEYGSARNPCDVTAQVIGDPESMFECSNALMSDPIYGTVVMAQPQAYDFATPRIKVLSDLAIRHGRMACNVMVSQWKSGPGTRETEIDPRVALFRSMDNCFATIAAWHAREARRDAGPRALGRVAGKDAREVAAATINRSLNTVLTEREAKQALSAYGVPVVSEWLVQTAEEAVRVASECGTPVVMKVESPDLPHKTEAGVIRLNVEGPDQVRAAYGEILANAARVIPMPRIHGVLLQPMVSKGVEIMVGARVDPQFGALIVVGLGGVFVELLKDTVVDLAPVTHVEALGMLQRLQGSSILDGFRGMAAVDRDGLAEVICRLSEFAADQGEKITELDVNPLICNGSSIVAVDAMIVKACEATSSVAS
jgi:acyl-CoA synthetase (NDP forming)